MSSICTGNASVALSSYKPSALLTTSSHNTNIDDKLGVSKLVNSTVTKPAAPSVVSRTRPSADNWSANDGSVIYAQPNSAKNHSQILDASTRQSSERPLKGQDTRTYIPSRAPSHNGHQAQYDEVPSYMNRSQPDIENRDTQLDSSTEQCHEVSVHKMGGDTDRGTQPSDKLAVTRSNWSIRTDITSDLLF